MQGRFLGTLNSERSTLNDQHSTLNFQVTLELFRRNDRARFEAANSQQVGIAGHEIVRASLGGEYKEHVVVRIAAGRYGHGSSCDGNLCVGQKCGKNGGLFVWREFELRILQDSDQLACGGF